MYHILEAIGIGIDHAGQGFIHNLLSRGCYLHTFRGDTVPAVSVNEGAELGKW